MGANSSKNYQHHAQPNRYRKPPLNRQNLGQRPMYDKLPSTTNTHHMMANYNPYVPSNNHVHNQTNQHVGPMHEHVQPYPCRRDQNGNAIYDQADYHKSGDKWTVTHCDHNNPECLGEFYKEGEQVFKMVHPDQLHKYGLNLEQQESNFNGQIPYDEPGQITERQVPELNSANFEQNYEDFYDEPLARVNSPGKLAEYSDNDSYNQRYSHLFV